MKRLAINDLARWKDRPHRQPLLLYGARQVGKTWLVREFARQYYEQLVELNFITNEKLSAIFASNISPDFIIGQLEMLCDVQINPATTLIFFDEIQESPRAMDSLKLFNELAPQYHIIAAGSYLGVTSMRWPVGQTEHYTLHPMTFYEFLLGLGEESLAQILQDLKTEQLTEAVREKLEDYLRKYFYVGGMPAVVRCFLETGDLAQVRQMQDKIVADYRSDFNRHIEKREIKRLNMLWDKLPLQLFRENKKFTYKLVKPGGRAAEFEVAMQWLIDTGLAYKVYRVEDPQLPLAMHFKANCFKLYLLDIGLFGACASIKPAALLLQGTDVVAAMYGALAEQFILQELKALNLSSIYYWAREAPAKAELDFLIELDQGGIIPVEVKSSHNTKARSLKIYLDKYHPQFAVRTSLNQWQVNDQRYDIPLYLFYQITKILAQENT